MTPVIPLSMTNISLISGATFTLNKNNRFTRCSFSRRPVKRTSCSQKLLFPVPAFVTSFPRSGLLHKSIQIKLSATGTDVTVEEPGSPVLDEGSSGASETQADEGKTKETSPARSDASPVSAQSRRARPARKSEMPPVKNEDLIPGAVFTGKVRSIQPFGAFVDFGAFTDGLVHVSRLSDSFVKDVGSVVSIGQEVQVRLIEANTETGRISLSMRERDDPAKVQQQDSPATASTDKPRPPRRNTGRSNQRREEAKTSKFIKGQELEGTVKNLTRSGAFISLPEGEEGFLPSSEESDDGLGSMLGSSSLEVGQEVSVRVLRLSRGQVTLTMKKEEDESKLDTEFSQGVIHAATNPFVLAFRKNKDIAAFLDDREKVEEPKKKASEEVGSLANQTEVLSDVPEVQEQPAGSDAESIGASTEAAFADENADSETTLSEEKEEDSYAVLDLEGSASTVGESILETPSTDSAEKGDEADSSAEIDSEASFVESPITEEIVENQPTAGDEISSAALVEKDDAEATSDENGSVIRSDVQEDSASPQEAKDELENVESTVASVDSIEATVSPFESQDVEEIAEKQVETAQDDAKIQTPAAKNKTTVSENKAVQEVVMDQAEDIKEVQAQTPAAEAETTISEEKAVEESQVEDTKEEVQIQTPTAEKETTISENKSVQEVVMDQAEDIKEVQVQTPAAKAETTISKEKAIEEVVESQVADTKEEVQIQTPAAENETTVFENKAVQEVVADQAEDIKEIQIQTHAVEAETTIYEEKAVEKVVESQVADTKEAQIQTPTSENETTISENKAVEEVVTDQAEDIKEVPVQTSTAEAESTISYEKAVEEVVDSQDGDTKEEVQIQTPAKKVESTQEKATKDEEDIVESTVASLDSREATILSSESQAVEEIAEKQVETAQEYAQIQTPSAEIETVVSESEAIQEVVTGQAKNFKEAQVQTPAAKAEITSFDERAVEEVVESQVGDTKKGVQIQAPTSENGTPEEVKSTLEKATKDEEETVPSTFASLDSSEATILSSESQAPEEIAVKKVETAQEDAQIQTPSAETETIVSENEAIQEVVTDQKENIKEVQVQKPAAEAETTSSDEKAVEEVVESQVGDSKEGVQIQTLTSENGTPEKVESTLENATKDEEETVESTIASLDSSEATILSTESQTLEEIAEKQVESAQEDAQIQTPSSETETIVSENEAVQEVVTDQAENIKEVQVQTPAAEAETTSSDEKALKEVVESQVGDTKEGVQIQTLTSENGILEKLESTLENAAKVALQVVEEVVESQVEDTKEEVDIQTPASVNGTPEKDESTPKSATKATISPALVKQLREETGAGMMDCKKALSETGGDIVKAQEYLRKKGLASAEKKASRATAEGRIGSYIHDSRIGVLVEVNCETDFVSRGEIFKELVDDIAMQVAACPQVQYLATEDVPEEFVNKEREIEMQKEDLASKPEQIRAKIVEGRIRKRLEELALLEQPYIKNDKVVIKDWVKQTIATIGENIKVKRYIRYNLGEGLEKKSQDFAAEVAAQTAAKPAPAPVNKQPAAPEVKETEEKKPAVAVSAALVKQLREETGAGMMDCKKALSETGGDLEKAQEYLRKKGLSTADKKSSRLAAEGRIGAYIHDSRIGVLIEINCETDFVGRSENFKALVDDLAMQVVACPQVQFVSIEDIPEEIVKKEKELEMQREDLASKPENIRERIVEGRVSKRLGELTLLEQPFIKNDSILVKDLVKQTVAALGENIKVRRFVRFTLGETTEGEKAEKES